MVLQKLRAGDYVWSCKNSGSQLAAEVPRTTCRLEIEPFECTSFPALLLAAERPLTTCRLKTVTVQMTRPISDCPSAAPERPEGRSCSQNARGCTELA